MLPQNKGLILTDYHFPKAYEDYELYHKYKFCRAHIEKLDDLIELANDIIRDVLVKGIAQPKDRDKMVSMNFLRNITNGGRRNVSSMNIFPIFL